MQYFHPESHLAINRLVDRLFTDVECRPHFVKLIKDFAGTDEVGETLNNMVSAVTKHFGTKVFENRFSIAPQNYPHLQINGHRVRVWVTSDRPWNRDHYIDTDIVQVRVRIGYGDAEVLDALIAHEVYVALWNEESCRDGIWKALLYVLQDDRCRCSNLLKAPGMCDTCKVTLQKDPCVICKSHKGRMVFKSLKRRQPKAYYHEMCKRRKL